MLERHMVRWIHLADFLPKRKDFIKPTMGEWWPSYILSGIAATGQSSSNTQEEETYIGDLYGPAIKCEYWAEILGFWNADVRRGNSHTKMICTLENSCIAEKCSNLSSVNHQHDTRLMFFSNASSSSWLLLVCWSDLLVCEAMYSYRWLPVFQRNIYLFLQG